MDEIVKDFLIESGENLDRLDQELVQLETDPRSAPLLASIFRTIHTIKGSCGFLGFTRLEKVAHAGESLLSRLRDGELSLTEESTSGLLAMVDAVRRMLSEIQTTGADGENGYPELLERLKQLTAGQTAGKSQNESEEVRILPADGEVGGSEVQELQSSTTTAAAPDSQPEPPQVPQEPPTHENVPQHRPAPGKLGGLLVERGQISSENLAVALGEQERGDQRRVGEILVALGLCKLEDVLAAQHIIEARGREQGTDTVRVGVNLLDKLMNLVGELVLARNQLLQFSNSNQDPGLHTISQRMNLIASELQEEVMKTRMQPIGNVWNKFPRTVRDLALNCGKEVRLEMEGQDTELDRTILEAVKDPLTHLVRNSIDHGIEIPATRARMGKPASGCLALRAFHEGGQVNIEIADDGAGLNLERIRSKAIERGIISADQASRMPDREIFNLIFLPGFSTAEKVTNVSGRGVGMDVVRTNLEKIGGTVDLHTAAGKGTTVRIKIPLTLAIIPALVVRCLGERFAIPQMSLTELVRLESMKGIENVHGAPVYRLRGQLLPLVYLSHVLGAKATKHGMASDSSANQNSQGANIVVLQAESQAFGVVVDDILDTEEIVVKPLGKQLKGIDVYSGATIMGDGSVALILDIMGLAKRANLLAQTHETTRDDKRAAALPSITDDENTLLLAENGSTGRVAIPLRIVARLEEFPSSVLEYAGTQEVMQYRGQIIPLVRLSQMVPPSMPADNDKNTIEVVVYSEGKRTVGLIVDRIVDIVEEKAQQTETLTPRAGVVGSFVTQQHVTDLLDVSKIVHDAVPGLFETDNIDATNQDVATV
ncbi:MAG TPA: chemotaxis protein CheW [Candidatus Solibacter sp.]|nr:chemotaxis protein CheW [Candidatus Solibacter sp.]